MICFGVKTGRSSPETQSKNRGLRQPRFRVHFIHNVVYYRIYRYDTQFEAIHTFCCQYLAFLLDI